jgi:hypothetical protein
LQSIPTTLIIIRYARCQLSTINQEAEGGENRECIHILYYYISLCLSLLCRLFDENAEMLTLFTKFKDLKTRDQQATSTELAEHAVSVMTTLDESIRCLDNVDSFLLYLHQVGQRHVKIPGFHKEYFWVRL